MDIADFLLKHLDWVVAVLCLVLAFNGILRGSMTSGPPAPFGYLWTRTYLSTGQARFFGWLYLLVGVLVVFNEMAGLVGLLCVFLLVWMTGTFLPSRD